MGSRAQRIFLFGFITFILLVDVCTYSGLVFDFAAMKTPLALISFCIIPCGFISGLLLFVRKFKSEGSHGLPPRFFTFTGLFLAVYFPKLLYVIFVIIENISISFVYIIMQTFGDPGNFPDFYNRTFLHGITLFILPLAGISFLAVLGGMLFGRFNFRVRRMDIPFPDLPAAFDGFRLIHISDLHLGSFDGHHNKIRKAVGMINREEADLILFTGDLVNNLAVETEGWIELISEMKSGHGKFAVLGNHDYGAYYDWPDEASRQENMARLIMTYEQAGFRLLLNDSETVTLGQEEIAILGVENWGLPPFEQYGDLERAREGTESIKFRILLSHDPSHWDEEVAGKTDIQLTLSGHTHGFQFGIRTTRFRWSPIQIRYPRWVGLYRQGNQKLHVSPGLGYIGYAGRIGIPPEITVIVLRTSES